VWVAREIHAHIRAAIEAVIAGSIAVTRTPLGSGRAGRRWVVPAASTENENQNDDIPLHPFLQGAGPYHTETSVPNSYELRRIFVDRS
jgi:hypothetical protein